MFGTEIVSCYPEKMVTVIIHIPPPAKIPVILILLSTFGNKTKEPNFVATSSFEIFRVSRSYPPDIIFDQETRAVSTTDKKKGL